MGSGYDDRVDDTDVLFDGRYALDGILGAGGTGTVHRAWDQVLDRPVALKMLRSGASDDSVHRVRLRAEAQLAGSLQHPGIAQIYDYGEAPAAGGDGPLIPYIAMHLVDGEPLDSVLKERRRLPPTRSWRSSPRSRRRSRWPTRPGSCTATSSPATS